MPSYRVQFDGMNNIASDYAVPPNKARNIVNCDVDDFGNLIIPRPGSTRVYSGTDCHSWFEYNHDFGLGFFVEGSTLKRLNADYSATTLATVGTAQVSYCRLADTIYYSNGTAFGKYQNGSVSEWGVDVPTMQPTAASTPTGGMFAGDYLVAIKWISNYEESGSLVARAVTVPEGGGIRLTAFPVPPAYVDTVAVYVSSVNGAILYHYRDYPAGISEVFVQFFVGSTPMRDQFARRVQPGTEITVHHGRIYWIDGHLVRYTEPFKYGLYTAMSFFQFEEDVTNIISVPGALYITTASKIYRVHGIDTEEMTLVTVKTYGAAAGSAFYDDNDSIGFVMSDVGFLAMTHEQAEELHSDQVATPIFTKGTTAAIEQNGIRKIVFVGQGATVSRMQHPDYSASEIARTGSNL